MQLLQHFKELTIRPKNAEELKGLILQLAIQGRLTANWREQNTDIEPASELLKRIQKEKEQLVKEKKLKKDKALPKILKEEIPFNLSKTWVWTRLGEIGTTNVGLTYKPAHKNDTGVPVLRSSNIQEGELCLKDLVRVNTKYREKDIIEEGDLLICARNGSRRLVGKCTIIGKIDEVMVFGAFMAIFRSNFNPYLQLFIQSPQYRSKLDGVETTTINQITQGNLKATTVPLPPLEEQKEVVKVVETLFKEVEQLEKLTVKRISLKEDFVTSALNQLTTNNANQEWPFLQAHFKSVFNENANFKKLRETVLQLAVQGKLTADWRANNLDTEDASVLLKRIQVEKAQLIADKKIKKEKALPPITKDDIPYVLPEGWVWCRWVDLLDAVKYPMKRGPFGSALRKADFVESGIRVFEQYNPINNDPDWMRYFITEDKYQKMKAFNTEAGDFLISCSGATLGRIVYLPEGTMPGIINQALLKLTLSQNVILSDYFLKLFRSYYIQEKIWQKAKGMAIPNMVGVKDLKMIMIPLPPLEEQKAIVEKVNALLGLCDALEQEVQQSQQHSEQLMQSCLREVFQEGVSS